MRQANDRNLRELAGHITSPPVFAHVRASTGSPGSADGLLTDQPVDAVAVELRVGRKVGLAPHTLARLLAQYDEIVLRPMCRLSGG
jgi:hypothetical protein